MRKPNLEDVVAHGSDYPVPQVAVPDHHDRRRPLTVCLWDAPNMDASLFSVTGADHHTIVRPQYDAFSRWLVNQRPPSPSKNEPGSPYDVEALLFLSVVSARSTQVAPFVTAARQSGFTVFCRDRDEGDIDDAIAYAKASAPVDDRFVFVTGVSGGGYATLGAYMRSHHNIRLCLAWVPISDLAAWYEESAARKSKETLRFFRDRGSVLGFLPREDAIDAPWELLRQVPNLDAYAPWGMSAEQARAQKGSIVKSSLGNAMRLIRPMVVIDEGHHAYSDTALKTLDGFNPSLMLELSATPRVASARASGSNILVDVRGTALDEAEMIKLPIQVDIKRWNDWQSCLTTAAHRLDALQREADALHAECARYIRPILLVQVERTGRDMRDAGFIHADDAKAFLLQLSLIHISAPTRPY
mgnify:CR=1 FL=1